MTRPGAIANRRGVNGTEQAVGLNSDEHVGGRLRSLNAQAAKDLPRGAH